MAHTFNPDTQEVCEATLLYNASSRTANDSKGYTEKLKEKNKKVKKKFYDFMIWGWVDESGTNILLLVACLTLF